MTYFAYDAVDTKHLPFPFVDAPFGISAATIARLIEQCHYRILGEKVLFGIRASICVNATGNWQKTLMLQEVIPDHKQLCCTLGIWDQKTNLLCAFKGSTVPHSIYIEEQKTQPTKRIANLLGQGLHEYLIGAHEPDDRPKEEGAFRLNRLIDVAVWRLFDENSRLNLHFDYGTPDDHIHAAHENSAIGFKSAGCQVIEGAHFPPQAPTGSYQYFRILADQSFIPSLDEVAKPYHYLLTHARHLYAITQGFSEDRYLQGSCGEEVRMIQEALMAKEYLADHGFNKGCFNGTTADALYRFQIDNKLTADVIAKPSDLELLVSK